MFRFLHLFGCSPSCERTNPSAIDPKAHLIAVRNLET